MRRVERKGWGWVRGGVSIDRGCLAIDRKRVDIQRVC